MAKTAIRVLLALVMLLHNPEVDATAEADCAIEEDTLTFDCSDKCASNVPCWLNTTVSSSTCTLTCLAGAFTKSKAGFYLLIPFGDEKSDEQLVEVGPEKVLLVNDENKYTSINNDYLKTIETLDIPRTTTRVGIVGGSAYTENIQSHVSILDLSSSLLTKATQVTYVALMNINLKDYKEDLVSMLPPNVESLVLSNTIMDAFPTGISKLKALRGVYFRNNYLQSITSTSGMNTLNELVVRGNSINSFTALFPNLTMLDIGRNKLAGPIPNVLSNYSALQQLWLDRNTFTAISQTDSIPNLYFLNASNNVFNTFEAVFPNLSTLDLSYNQLKEIPETIFSHEKLTNLSLANNIMKGITLTSSQAAFLDNLVDFQFDKSSISTDCADSERASVHGMEFCIDADQATPADSTVADTGSSSSLPVIIGIVGGALVLAIIIAALVLRSRKNSSRKDSYVMDGTMPTMAGTDGTGTVSLWYDVDLLAVKVNAEEIEDVKPIGKGAFGDVWLVKYRKTQLLASKRLRKSEATRSRIKSFIEEIKLVAKLEHPHIVTFVGAAWTIESDLQALFEYMDGGDLRDYLENPHISRAWTHEKVQIAIDVAEALVYVHSFSPPLVHRDLKSRNVLLMSSDAQAKLTDFGVSRFRSEDNTMTSGVGTGKWLAPEVISGSTDYGSPADIFSFGAVLSELDSHKLPYDELRGPNGTRVADVALLQMIASGQVRPSLGASCPDKIAELASRCFSLSPGDRPAAAELAYALRVFKKSMETAN